MHCNLKQRREPCGLPVQFGYYCYTLLLLLEEFILIVYCFSNTEVM